MAEVNRQFLLKSRPVGRIRESDFEYREQPVPVPGAGQVLVRNVYLSLDPAMRGWMNAGRSYIPPVAIGDVMRGITVGRVAASNHPGFAEGDIASGLLGWQDYGVAEAKHLEKVSHGLPMTASLSVLGLTGRTAYFGLLDVGKPEKGETVVVSGAAGAVGSVAGQIARLKGCRVVGIAGSRDKCAWLTGELGFDAAVDYKTGDLERDLRRHCPGGVDVFYDNVGGGTLDTVLRLINTGARIVICGAISAYNATEPVPGPYNLRMLLVKRARMEGFIIFDYRDRYAEATARLAQWVEEGKIAYAEDVVDGLEKAPKVINRLFDGANTGKLIIRISDEP